MIKAKSLYLSENEDFHKFLDTVSDNTGKKFTERWIQNMTENKDLFQQTGWACSHLQDAELNKTAVIMCSSPALRKQVDVLRELQRDKDFVLCGLSSNLEFLLNNGIQPKYVIVCDADPSTGKDWDNVDMDRTKDITLVASTFSFPPMLKRWKGKLRFFVLGESDKRLIRKHKKWYNPINGNGEIFPSLMGQSNIMTAFSILVLGCRVVIFVGNELSYEKDESTYYVDRKDDRDKDRKYPHGDIYGNIVYTTPNLLALKLALEGFLELIKGYAWFFNCTEAGIFGVTKRFPDYRVPWITQLTLKNGIAQARSIMRTGQPFYS